MGLKRLILRLITRHRSFKTYPASTGGLSMERMLGSIKVGGEYSPGRNTPK